MSGMVHLKVGHAQQPLLCNGGPEGDKVSCRITRHIIHVLCHCFLVGQQHLPTGTALLHCLGEAQLGILITMRAGNPLETMYCPPVQRYMGSIYHVLGCCYSVCIGHV